MAHEAPMYLLILFLSPMLCDGKVQLAAQAEQAPVPVLPGDQALEVQWGEVKLGDKLAVW